MPITKCAVCGESNLRVTQIAGLARGSCEVCHHCQRLDIDKIDYSTVTMGRSGIESSRLDSQVHFLERVDFGDVVLEIGCANGALARALKAKHKIGRYDGIEFSPAAEEAKLCMNAVFKQGLPELLNSRAITPSSYSCIIMSHCLEHFGLYDLHEQIAALHRALAPNGFVFIEVPNQSGHPGLPFDDNRSHIHFFSLSSLCRLLTVGGLDVLSAETNARFDARYPDSIRTLSRRFAVSNLTARRPLSDHKLMQGVDKIIIWGAGKMSEELLVHFFDLSLVDFFVDSNTAKQGTTYLGVPVKAPAVLAECTDPVVLINSLEFEDSIRRQLSEQFSGIQRVIGIGQLLS